MCKQNFSQPYGGYADGNRAQDIKHSHPHSALIHKRETLARESGKCCKTTTDTYCKKELPRALIEGCEADTYEE